jgi:hypothetical protein
MKIAISISLLALSISFLMTVSFQTNALATIYTGSITNLGITDTAAFDAATLKGVGNAWGVLSTTAQPRGLTLSWTVASVGSNWQYDYTLAGATKAVDKYLTNFDLGTSSDFSPSDILSWTAYRASATTNASPSTGINMIDVSSSTTASLSAASITEPSSPSKTIYGIQWHISGAPTNIVKDYASTMFTLSFLSDRSPLWGDFLAWSETSSGGSSPLAWDKQFGIPTTALVGDGNNGGYVLVPGATVPVPPSLILFGSGLISLIGFGFRKRG